MKFMIVAIFASLVLPLLSLLDKSSQAEKNLHTTLKFAPFIFVSFILARKIITLYMRRIGRHKDKQSSPDDTLK